MLRWPVWLALLWVLFPGIGWAAEPVPLPALTARVTDLTNTLDATQRGRLEAQLAAIERSGRAQIAVLLLPTTQPEPIEAFGIRLAETWKIGRKGKDDGLIIIVAKNDRKMRIEVGYGLEGAIPDAIAKRIVAERMAPAFKQEDFFGGLIAAVGALDAAIGGPASGAATTADPGPAKLTAALAPSERHPNLISWLFGTIVAAGVLRLMFGLLGSLAATAVGAWLGFMVFGSLAFAIGAAVLVFVFSFVNLFSGSGGSSSGGGGFGGSSSSGGGFSGSGGSFGGGGASGDW
jgi:uncharacterized protein